MRPFRSALRRFVQRFGYDIHRIGGKRLGRNHFADIRHLCSDRGVKLVFDVGANTGRSAELFAEEFPTARILSFEPFPEAYGQLVAKIGHLPKVEPLMLGLGSTKGSRRMYVRSGSELNSLLSPSASAAEYIDAESISRQGECDVQITTLDFFCSERGIDSIDLLKIDTQGTELSILQGASESLRNGHIRTIFLEVNFVCLYEGQASFAEILNFLDGLNYSLVGLYEPAFVDEGFLKWADALFVQRLQQ